MSVEKKERSDQILNVFNRNVTQIEKCLEYDLKEVSIILIVSTFESFMNDVFMFCETLWFSHTREGINPELTTLDARKILREYLEDIKMYDNFLKTRYVYSNMSNPDIISLKDMFKNERKISFQNLKSKHGVKVAYKAFFDIDIYKILDVDGKKSSKMWGELDRLIKERHKIMHEAKVTEFSEDEIRKVLESIKYLEDCLIQKLLNRELGCGSGPFFMYDRK